jgi:hypothetical protein
MNAGWIVVGIEEGDEIVVEIGDGIIAMVVIERGTKDAIEIIERLEKVGRVILDIRRDQQVHRIKTSKRAIAWRRKRASLVWRIDYDNWRMERYRWMTGWIEIYAATEPNAVASETIETSKKVLEVEQEEVEHDEQLLRCRFH